MENMERKEKILKEVEKAMNSGLYSVASLEMFDKLSELEMSEDLFLHLEYTNDLLKDYLSELMELGDKKPGLHEFLKTLKFGDMVDNQEFEKENPFLVLLYSQLPRETAMARLIKYAKSGKQLSSKELFALNNTLLYGTYSEGASFIRTENSKVVGRFVDGERKIDYFPIDHKEVREAADRIVELYNGRLSGELFDNVFFQPFLVHGLLGALQLFYDGNTRMGRVMQHALMWQLIKEKASFDFEMPPLYATKSYYPKRSEYWDKISGLVKNGDNEAWNDWFDFNLTMVEDTMYVGRKNIRTLSKKLEK